MLVFKSPNLIKWEYIEPYKYSVVFKDDKLLINDEGAKSKINLNSNKAFRSLNNLIIKSVKGDMFDENSFDIRYFKNSSNYIVRFLSKENSIRSFINEFILTFDKRSLRVIEIRMIENSEDYTLLKFINQSFNEPVSNEIFSN
jgi:outer membrane lipoprotein carrier protein